MSPQTAISRPRGSDQGTHSPPAPLAPADPQQAPEASTPPRELCINCERASDAWLDYRPAPRRHLTAIGRPGIREYKEAQAARFEEWKATILRQQQGIRDSCSDACWL